MAVNKDITVDQGASHVEVFTIEVLTDPQLPFDASTNPYIPLDLSFASIMMQVRQSYTTSSVILTATDTNGRMVKTDPVNGTFELRVGPDDLELVKGNTGEINYLYDILIDLSPGNIIKVAEGNFIVVRKITRI